METLITRFQAGLARVHHLSHGASSSDVLVRSLLDAVARHDTALVASLFVSRAEYAHLYFPVSDLARPPYELDPALAWFQLASESERDIRKTLRILGGRRLEYVGHACTPDRVSRGGARVWRNCTIAWREPPHGLREASIFDAIIEYEGQFKFLSYAGSF